MLTYPPVTLSERVADAACGPHEARLQSTEDTVLAAMSPLPGVPVGVRCITVAATKTIEVVLPDGTAPSALASSITALAEDGWFVVVLTPCERFGEAHAGLRGMPCRIQQWWIDDDDVAFGPIEIP
jgi:hypothetical protein